MNWRPRTTPAASHQLGLVDATLLATACLVLVNAAVIAIAVPPPVRRWSVRALQHAHDAGQHLAVGLLAAAVIWLWQRYGPRGRRWGYLALAVTSVGIGALALPEDLERFSGRLVKGADPDLVHAVLVTAVSLGPVALALCGSLLSRPRWRWAAVAAGFVALAGNHFILRTGYAGAHLFLAFGGGVLMATALETAPRRVEPPRPVRITVLAGCLALVGLCAAFPPDNAVLMQMLRVDGSVVVPFLSRIRARQIRTEARVPERWRPWFRSRSKAPPVPPGRPVLPKNGIVILLTIDALRADMLLGRRWDASLPTLARLRDTSVNFTRARTPGSQTVVTLSSLFMGTYFSQQYWTRRPGVRDLWPHEDRSPRFPAILTEAGVKTVTFATAKMFTNDYGMVSGFERNRYVKGPRRWYAYSHQVIPLLKKKLRKLGRKESLFAYIHLLDAHYTMSPFGKKLPRKQRFVRNLAAIDRQLAKLIATLRARKLLGRTALIVTADHGEGFGQHGTKYHCETLYEELLHVPLLMKLPGVKRRTVSTPVSIIDLGPTILDLFRLPTPGHYMGQSLTGFLRGESPELTRPIVAEGRLKKSLVFEDGHKIIVDDRHHTVELYDLIRDPRELNNLYEENNPLAVERLVLLRKFFAAHTIQRAGYKVPYRY
jgi:hypothetical protein